MSQIPAPYAQPVIEILYLGTTGYGPNGRMPREEWRKTCVTNLMAGKNQFKSWQSQVLAVNTKPEEVSFDLRINGNRQTKWADCCTLDFEGLSLEADFNANEFEFLLPCSFRHANFKGNSIFQSAMFRNFVSFESVIFNQIAWFEGATFKMFAQFGKTEFDGLNSFKSACFELGISFENAIFKRMGNFEKASFKAVPPRFRGVDIATTRLEFSGDDYFPKGHAEGSDLQDVVKDISFLKRLSEEHGQTEQALNFNAMELQAKRLLPDATWTFKTVTWLYEVISNYGRSFAKPFGIYAALLFLTFLIALEHSADIVPRDTPARQMWAARVTLEDPNPLKLDGVRAAFEYTLFRAAGVLDFSDSGKHTEEVALRLFGQKIEPWYMRIWGVFKAIASTALLFLAALGLRNKYRIK